MAIPVQTSASDTWELHWKTSVEDSSMCIWSGDPWTSWSSHHRCWWRFGHWSGFFDATSKINFTETDRHYDGDDQSWIFLCPKHRFWLPFKSLAVNSQYTSLLFDIPNGKQKPFGNTRKLPSLLDSGSKKSTGWSLATGIWTEVNSRSPPHRSAATVILSFSSKTRRRCPTSIAKINFQHCQREAHSCATSSIQKFLFNPRWIEFVVAFLSRIKRQRSTIFKRHRSKHERNILHYRPTSYDDQRGREMIAKAWFNSKTSSTDELVDRREVWQSIVIFHLLNRLIFAFE